MVSTPIGSPKAFMCVWCTKISVPPVEGVAKPKPFLLSNHLTVAVWAMTVDWCVR